MRDVVHARNTILVIKKNSGGKKNQKLLRYLVKTEVLSCLRLKVLIDP